VRAVDLAACHGSLAAEGLHRYLRRGWHRRWPPVREHGGLTLGDADGRERAAAAAGAAQAAGHKVTLLSAEEIGARFPGLRVPPGYTGVYEPRAGWLPVRSVAAAMLRDARASRGSVRLLRARVTDVLTAGPRVAGVQTAAGPVPARAVLLAAGAGSAPLARSVGVPLSLVNRSISYCLFEVEDEMLRWLPTVADAGTGGWLRRWNAGPVLLAGVTSRETGVPATVEWTVPVAEQRRVREVMERRCPSLATARAVGGVTAYDAMAVGGDGAVTAWPQPRGLITAAGWNGGGFKIAPAVGDRVADLIRKVIE
jgi:glycine/D-amino acid oxidase-like deaminating enzyme